MNLTLWSILKIRLILLWKIGKNGSLLSFSTPNHTPIYQRLSSRCCPVIFLAILVSDNSYYSNFGFLFPQTSEHTGQGFCACPANFVPSQHFNDSARVSSESSQRSPNQCQKCPSIIISIASTKLASLDRINLELLMRSCLRPIASTSKP